MAEKKVITVEIDGQPAANSLKQLYAQAKQMREALQNLNPDIDGDKIEAIRKQYEAVQEQIQNVSQATGLARQATSSFGDTLANIGKAAFWLAILQFVYDWAKAFIGVTQEVAKTRKEISLLTDATGKDLDDLTTRATAIAKTFGADYMEVVKSANAVAKQFGITQKEAFELIEKGFEQNGTAFTDKLADLQEFPIQFKNAGISAESYFKIVNQEIKGGIFDNKLQDGIYEMMLRLKEFTKAQQDALTAAFGGEFTQKLLTDIDTGAISTEKAYVRIMTQAEKTGLSVTQLQTLTADVFGSPTEDVGGAIFAWENYKKAIDTTNESTNEYAKGNKAALDSAKVLSSAQNELASVLEKQNGNFQNFANQGLAIAARLLTVVIEKVFSVGELMYEAAKSVGELLKSFGLLNENTDLGATLISVFSFAIDSLLIPVRLLVVIVKAVADGFTFLTNSVNAYLSTSPNLTKFFATIGEYLSAIGNGIGEVLKGFGQLFTMVGLLPEKKSITLETKKVETDSTGTGIKTKTDSKVLTEAEKAAQKAREDAAKKPREDANKLEDDKLKDEIKANEIREALRIKAIADETERQKEELRAKAVKDAQDVNTLKINELAKADLRKQIAEQLNADLKAIDDKAAEETLLARTESAKELDLMEIQAKKNAQQDALTGLQGDVVAAENSEDPQAIFDAKLALLQEQQAIELENLELTENQKYLILQEYTAKRQDLYNERAAQEQQNANAIAGALVETTANFAKAAGEQTAIGKGLLVASKTLAAGQIVMNSIIEVSNIFKGFSALPIVGQVLGAIQAAVAVSRAAAAISSLNSIKFADGGLLSGPSHANGGIRGTGKFGAFEAEGGEFFVNKQATANNLGALQTLNTYGKNTQFDIVPKIRFAMGGQLPNTTPTVTSAAIFNQGTDFSQVIENNNQNFAMLGQKLDNAQDKKVVLVYTDLETVNADVTKIREY